MKFTTTILTSLLILATSAAPSSPALTSPLEDRAAEQIICGKCAFSGAYCDAGGAYHACYGQQGCGGATRCPGGCYFEPGNPDYGQQAQC